VELVLLCVSFACAQRALLSSAGNGGPLDGGLFEFQLPTDQSGACDQACPLVYLKKDGKLNGAFKFEIYRVYELNATGGECCAGGANCDIFATGTCNFHVLFQMFNYFNQTITLPGKAVTYSGYIPNTPVQPMTPCTQADVQQGTYTMCVRVDISWQVVDTAMSVTLGNQVMNLKQSSLFGKLKIGNWNFGPNSVGYRIKFDLGLRGTNFNSVTMNPGSITNPNQPVSSFTSMIVQDVQKRVAALSVFYYVVYNNAPTVAANLTQVSGPYTLQTDLNGRFVYIDVPRNDASQSAEVYFNLYFPTLTGEVPDMTGAVVPLQKWFGTMFFLLVLLTYL